MPPSVFPQVLSTSRVVNECLLKECWIPDMVTHFASWKPYISSPRGFYLCSRGEGGA